MKFITNRIYSISETYKALKLLMSCIVEDIKTQPDVEDNKKRYLKLVNEMNEEQQLRLNNYISWLQVVWVLILCWFFSSVYFKDKVSLLFSMFFMCYLYVILGYRLWVLNTQEYPSFFQYLKIFKKNLLGSLPLKRIEIKK